MERKKITCSGLSLHVIKLDVKRPILNQYTMCVVRTYVGKVCFPDLISSVVKKIYISTLLIYSVVIVGLFDFRVVDSSPSPDL